jgi:hypothetical protein
VQDGGENEMKELQINLSVDMQLGIGGDTWPAAELFCHLILSTQWYRFFQSLLRNKKVLELGSGHGLVGILIDRVFDVESVVITDLANYVELIGKNIDTNGCKRCSANAIDWLQFDPRTINFDNEEKFDIILALECVYRRELFLPLINTLEAKSYATTNGSKKNTVIILGITRDFANEQFFTLLLQRGYKYRKVPQSSFHLTEAQRQRFDVSHIGILMIYKSDVY